MKTKIIIPIVVLSLILVSKPIFAKAVTSTPAVNRNQVRQEIKEEKQVNNQESKQARIKNVYEAIKNGLNKRHEALLKIKAKIDARITKNPMNKDLANAKTELAKFAAAEAKYQTDLKALESKFEILKTSTKPSEIIKGLKDSTNLVRQDLNAIKKVLTSTVTALAKAPKLEVTKTE